MTKYEAAVRENEIKKAIWHLENGPSKFSFRAHQIVLKAQLQLEKDKFRSWQTDHKQKAKNLRDIKKEFIDRVIKIEFPPFQGDAGGKNPVENRNREISKNGNSSPQ